MRQVTALALDRSRVITSNQRLHWRAKAEKVAHLRSCGQLCIHPRLKPVTVRQRVTVNISFPDHRRRDVGNWYPTIKALVDGFTDAGVWPDDNGEWVVGPDLRESPMLSRKGQVWFEFVLEDAA